MNGERGQNVFVRDDEYIELDQSPTHFESSEDEDEQLIDCDNSPGGISNASKASHQKGKKSQHLSSFKLSLHGGEEDSNPKVVSG